MDEIILENITYVSARHAASFLKCSNDYVGKLARQGKLEAIRQKNLWYIRAESIEKYLRESAMQKEIRKKELSKQREKEYHSLQPVVSNFHVKNALMIIACFIIAFSLHVVAGRETVARLGLTEISADIRHATSENTARVVKDVRSASIIVKKNGDKMFARINNGLNHNMAQASASLDFAAQRMLSIYNMIVK